LLDIDCHDGAPVLGWWIPVDNTHH
jgi:hypothetical protein